MELPDDVAADSDTDSSSDSSDSGSDNSDSGSDPTLLLPPTRRMVLPW